MKAVDYFEKYRDEVSAANTDEEIERAILQLNDEIVDEMKEIMKKRNIHKISSAKSTILEFNQKWNKIIRLFEKANINCYMKVDGFYLNLQAIYSDMGIII